MIKPLLCVVAIGAALGYMLPTGGATAPEPVATAAAGQSRETLLERRSNGHFYVEAMVNEQPVDFVVDTGASTVALTVRDARRLNIGFDPSRFTTVGTGASGPVRGQQVKLDVVDIDGKRVSQVRGVVLEGLDVSLLGQSYLSRISSVQMNGDYMSLR